MPFSMGDSRKLNVCGSSMSRERFAYAEHPSLELVIEAQGEAVDEPAAVQLDHVVVRASVGPGDEFHRICRDTRGYRIAVGSKSAADLAAEMTQGGA